MYEGYLLKAWKFSLLVTTIFCIIEKYAYSTDSTKRLCLYICVHVYMGYMLYMCLCAWLTLNVIY